MKTAQLLQTLNDQLSELSALVAPLAEHATLSPRFDRQLFHTRSTLMQAYLAEAQHNFNQLRQAVERQQLPQVVWIAERLAAQIAALRRAYKLIYKSGLTLDEARAALAQEEAALDGNPAGRLRSMRAFLDNASRGIVR